MSALAQLIKSAGGPVSRTPQRLRELPVTLDRERQVELETVLHLRDGFRALDGALLVRPSVSVAATAGVEAWNRLSGWRKPYTQASELLFFADDIHGHAFGLYRDAIVRFDPERGTFEHYAFKLETWAARVLEERDTLGGQALDAWNASGNPELASNEKLQPSIPNLVHDGEPRDHLKRTDEDLMRRYGRLFRAYAAADNIAAAVDTTWWLDDDPTEPPPAPPTTSDSTA